MKTNTKHAICLEEDNPSHLPMNEPHRTDDDQKEVHSFIKKLRVDTYFEITNGTAITVDLVILFESKKDTSFSEDLISVRPGKSYIHQIQSSKKLSNITLKYSKKSPHGYLNPTILSDGSLRVTIQNEKNSYFLHRNHYEHEFSSNPFQYENLTEFQKFYNQSCAYVNFICEQEGLGTIDFLNQQRNELYSQNNMANLLTQNPQLLDSPIHRIPLITHKIWVTSNDGPKGPPDQYITWYENSIEHNRTSDGWTHYFWIENKEKQSNLYNKLKNHPSITVMELDSLTFETRNMCKDIIQRKPIGFAGQVSDIIRIELLNQFGGFYLDTDYEIFHSLTPYSKAYDLVTGLEHMSPSLCNAFIASKPKHPFLIKALELIKRNFSDQAPYYVKRDSTLEDGLNAIVLTGPCMITMAFAMAAGRDKNRDITFPPQILFPARRDTYPASENVTPESSVPPQAIGAHYWHVTWRNPAFM